jgi:hypothetical protein
MRAEEVVLRLGRFVETTLPPVSHEVRNRNHDEAVRLTEPGQIGRTRHGAVIVDDFANYPGRVAPARTARSTAASVWPRRSRTPPGRARSGKTCPGRPKS